MRLEEMCQKLDTLLTSRQGTGEKVEAAVDALCRIFGVQQNEVAIFGYDAAQESFGFLWPVELKKSGSIPASADRSLVAVTARERRGQINNSFASTPHLFVFEAFGPEKGAPIQRIMSAPMLKGDELAGVIQVCRKAPEADASLKKFTEPELQALCALAKVIGGRL